MKQLESIRSRDGRARIKYDKFLCSWSDTITSRPYSVFIDGTAGNCFVHLDQAVSYLTAKGHSFKELN